MKQTTLLEEIHSIIMDLTELSSVGFETKKIDGHSFLTYMGYIVGEKDGEYYYIDNNNKLQCIQQKVSDQEVADAVNKCIQEYFQGKK